MTLQQLEYIIAVERHGQFVKAAAACNVTQSTLSYMIQKLETELDTIIFDRNSQPIRPTVQGEVIIQKAKVIILNAEQLKENLLLERKKEEGSLNMGIIPTVAPYILPKLIKQLRDNYPKIHLHIEEIPTSSITEKMERAELDLALMATPLENDELLEIPIYYEPFVAYISSDEQMYSQKEILSTDMPKDNLWVLKEGHCLRNQVLDVCKDRNNNSAIYEAGSIDTLVKIVDENGGYTIIPKLHVGLINETQKQRLRPIISPEPNREISLVVRKDFIYERLINIIADTIKNIIPDEMVNSRLKKYTIRF